MCAFGNGCMTAGYRRGMMQVVVGGTVGQWDSSKYCYPKSKKNFYIYISIYIDI